jgi:hypothetical protein
MKTQKERELPSQRTCLKILTCHYCTAAPDAEFERTFEETFEGICSAASAIPALSY